MKSLSHIIKQKREINYKNELIFLFNKLNYLLYQVYLNMFDTFE